MRTNIPEKLLKITDDIDAHGSANLTRLAVLKKWFEKPERLSAFAIWIAARATSRKGKTGGVAAELFRKARTLLAEAERCCPKVNRQAAKALHDELRNFQNEYENQRWGRVRIVHNWNLMLVEHGLAIYLWNLDSPAHGYRLAVSYCQHYDPRYGNGLNGPSRTKILEIVRFMFTIEALEDGPE
ncbi:MAG TPA: hypothetical protein VMF08_17170 [Candidatus Sulfotelmatobacter sp.]|nr:hypothetical protein [Candidatus Sulfotelmatobacter sp.]